jgi:HK97 family phage prohead protease
MPWYIAKSAKCAASKPWAVIKDSDSSVAGCHATKDAAKKQLSALYANENKSAAPPGRSRMDTLRDLDVVRGIPAQRKPLELRTAAADGMPTLEVRFSPFDTWYEVDSWFEGQFMERTVRGAFAKTMRESGQSVRMLYDHGYDPQVGNKVLAPIDDLREDADSAVSEGQLFDTSYNRDLLPGLQAGVYGSSFRFRVLKDAWDDEPGVSSYNPTGLPERSITEVRLFECGPVTFPANPDATANVRSVSLTDMFYARLRTRDPQRYEELRARTLALRTPDQAAAPGTVDGPGAAPAVPDEPAPGHSHRQSDVARAIRMGRALRGIAA